MTADHWGYVLAAWGLAAVVLGLYWRSLGRRERALAAVSPAASRAREAAEPGARAARAAERPPRDRGA